MTFKITTDKNSKLRLTLYATNGNEIAHSSKGYNTETEIFAIIDQIQKGQYFAEIETANQKVNGHTVYFTIYNEEAEVLLVSNNYVSQNHRNTYQQVMASASKGIQAISNKNYTSKIVKLY